mgnify:CR=1 FL=1
MGQGYTMCVKRKDRLSAFEEHSAWPGGCTSTHVLDTTRACATQARTLARSPVCERRDDEAAAVAQVLVAISQRRIEHAHHHRLAGGVPAVAVCVCVRVCVCVCVRVSVCVSCICVCVEGVIRRGVDRAGRRVPEGACVPRHHGGGRHLLKWACGAMCSLTGAGWSTRNRSH